MNKGKGGKGEWLEVGGNELRVVKRRSVDDGIMNKFRERWKS